MNLDLTLLEQRLVGLPTAACADPSPVRTATEGDLVTALVTFDEHIAAQYVRARMKYAIGRLETPRPLGDPVSDGLVAWGACLTWRELQAVTT